MAYCADFSRCAEAILEHFLLILGPIAVAAHLSNSSQFPLSREITWGPKTPSPHVRKVMAYCADFSRCAEAILEHFLGPLETVRESLRGVPVLVLLLQENECCQFLRASPFLAVSIDLGRQGEVGQNLLAEFTHKVAGSNNAPLS